MYKKLINEINKIKSSIVIIIMMIIINDKIKKTDKKNGIKKYILLVNTRE